MAKFLVYYAVYCLAVVIVTEAKPIEITGYDELEPYGYKILRGSVNYKCEGEILFKISLNRTKEAAYLRDVYMSICKSSWSNKWCTSPDSYFITQACSNKKTDMDTAQACVLDVGTMCKVVERDRMYGNWFHNVYVVRVVGTANGMIYSTKNFAMSPMRYQLQCKNSSALLGSRIRGYAKQCASSNYI